MVTENGTLAIWKNILSNAKLALGYWNKNDKDNPFIEISESTIVTWGGAKENTDATDQKRNYSRVSISVGEPTDAQKKTYAEGNYPTAFMGYKTGSNSCTITNNYAFVFPDIDDGSPDNINYNGTTKDTYGGWGTVNALGLYVGDTLYYASPISDIVTDHAMELRFPTQQLSFTLVFSESNIQSITSNS